MRVCVWMAFALMVLTPGLTGCSWLFMQEAPPKDLWELGPAQECSDSYALPIADVLVSVGAGLGGLAWVAYLPDASPNDRDEVAFIGASMLSMGGLLGVSAWYGFPVAAQCKEHLIKAPKPQAEAKVVAVARRRDMSVPVEKRVEKSEPAELVLSRSCALPQSMSAKDRERFEPYSSACRKGDAQETFKGGMAALSEFEAASEFDPYSAQSAALANVTIQLLSAACLDGHPDACYQANQAARLYPLSAREGNNQFRKALLSKACELGRQDCSLCSFALKTWMLDGCKMTIHRERAF